MWPARSCQRFQSWWRASVRTHCSTEGLFGICRSQGTWAPYCSTKPSVHQCHHEVYTMATCPHRHVGIIKGSPVDCIVTLHAFSSVHWNPKVFTENLAWSKATFSDICHIRHVQECSLEETSFGFTSLLPEETPVDGAQRQAAPLL